MFASIIGYCFSFVIGRVFACQVLCMHKLCVWSAVEYVVSPSECF